MTRCKRVHNRCASTFVLIIVNAREKNDDESTRVSPLKKRATKRVASAAGAARFDCRHDVDKISRNVKTCLSSFAFEKRKEKKIREETTVKTIFVRRAVFNKVC